MKSGRISVQVTTEPIPLDVISEWPAPNAHGAMNVFMGLVRDLNLGKEVIAIEYDCFVPLCENVFQEIASEAQERWGLESDILIIHRHGHIKVGDPSVLVLATSKHRDESYRITRYVIEEIKVRAPIWKKEFYKDGETDWVRGHALCQHRKVDHHETSGSHTCGGQVHTHGPR